MFSEKINYVCAGNTKIVWNCGWNRVEEQRKWEKKSQSNKDSVLKPCLKRNTKIDRIRILTLRQETGEAKVGNLKE